MEVFHGSCKLIPVKIITEECIKLSDEFIVELVEALSSEMDPNLVCATAGTNIIRAWQSFEFDWKHDLIG